MHWFNDRSLSACVDEMAEDGVGVIADFLKPSVRKILLEELERYDFSPQPKTYGYFNTYQDYSAIREFSPRSVFLEVAAGVEDWLNAKFGYHLPTYLEEPLHFSEKMAQRYTPCDIGIAPHRDEKIYVNMVVLLVLEGRGTFGICDDRQKTNPRPIRNEPGDLLLMRGAGMLGFELGPFHFVEKILERRTILTLRQQRQQTA